MIIIWISFLNAAEKRTPECNVTSWLCLLLMLLVFMLQPILQASIKSFTRNFK